MSGARVCSKRGGVVRGGLVTAGVVSMVCGSALGADVRVLAKPGTEVARAGVTERIAQISTSTGAWLSPTLSENGVVTFRCTLSGRTSQTSNAIVRCDDRGNAILLASGGDPVAGASGAQFGQFPDLYCNNAGEVVFSSRLIGSGITSSTDFGYWRAGGMSTTPALLVREGSVASFGTSTTPASGTFASFADAGVAKEADDWFGVRGTLISTGTAVVTWRQNDAVADFCVRTGSPARNATGGDLGSGLTLYEPRMYKSDNGFAVIEATITGAGTSSSNNYGLWLKRPEVSRDVDVELVVRKGMAAPAELGFPNGSTMTLSASTSTPPAVDSRGRVVFAASVVSPTGAVTGCLVRFTPGPRGTAGTYSTILRGGASTIANLPGLTVAGVRSPSTSTKAYYCSANGDRVVAWVMLQGAGVLTSNANALVTCDTDSAAPGGIRVRSVMRGGQQIPGCEPGAVYFNSELVMSMHVGPDGSIAAWTHISGNNIPTNRDKCMLLLRGQDLRLLCREGDPIPETTGRSVADLGLQVPLVRQNRNGEAILVFGTNSSASGYINPPVVTAVDRSGSWRTLFGEALPLIPSNDSPFIVRRFTNPELNNSGQVAATVEALNVGWVTILASLGCSVDVNNDGNVTTQDLFEFLTAFYGGDTVGDFNRSGSTSVQDVFDFLAAYFRGC